MRCMAEFSHIATYFFEYKIFWITLSLFEPDPLEPPGAMTRKGTTTIAATSKGDGKHLDSIRPSCGPDDFPSAR